MIGDVLKIVMSDLLFRVPLIQCDYMFFLALAVNT